jgi:glycosyltransferase involved in cell wall biosynthesis
MISVVCTLFNYREYIAGLMKSVVRQTYQDWELIIVDDGSTDGPDEIIRAYRKKCKKIRYIKLKKNRGYAIAKNAGILESKGDYIVMIDADDMLTPDALEKRYAALSTSKKLWLHTRAYMLKGDKKYEERSQHATALAMQKAEDFSVQYESAVHAQTTMVKREFHRILGLYDEELRHSADKEMWMRALTFGITPVYLPECTCVYRLHARQMHRSTFKLKTRKSYKKLIQTKINLRRSQGITKSNTRMLPDAVL